MAGLNGVMYMEIFQYSFMNKALIIGLMVGTICPVIGLFIVLRRMSLIADALAHISLAGVAAGLLSGANPILSASLFSITGALLIEKLRTKYQNFSEISIAIMLSAGLALGAVLLSLGQGFNDNVFSYLFGSIIVTGQWDFWIIAGTGSVVLAFILLIFKEMYFIVFDEEYARASGIPVGVLNIIFTVLTSLTIAVSMRVIGILLVSSLMIIPVASSLQIARSIKEAVIYSIVFGVVSVVSGLVVSFYLNLAAGGTIILVAIAQLAGVLSYKSLVQPKPVHKIEPARSNQHQA